MHGTDFLRLTIDRAPPRGRVAWLACQLRDAIHEGTLTAGVRLPSTRVLAGELSVARGTVVEAYRRLAEEGLLVSNRGGGTVVADLPAADLPSTAVPARSAPAAGTQAEPMLDVSSGMPDLSAFPRAAWLRAERVVLRTATERQLGYADPQGVPRLRAALAGWLSRSRGVSVTADRIIITAGVTGALSLLAQVLSDRAVTGCGVEDPGAEGNRRILDYWMDAVEPIPVDDEGLDIGVLAQSGLSAVLVTPAHQFPTGVVLSAGRRRALIAWAEQSGGIVIEDDYDAEYRYDRAPVRALQAMAPECVVHVSSLSKVLAPALRIGWMIAPAGMCAELVRKRWASDLGSPALPQFVLAELIENGMLERQLRTLRLRHRQRRDAAVDAIGRYLPGCRIQGVAAGLHLVITLPGHIDDIDLSARARAAGIGVQPLSQHRFAPGPPGLVIGYGPHPAPRLEQAIRTLGALAGYRSV